MFFFTLATQTARGQKEERALGPISVQLSEKNHGKRDEDEEV